MLGLDDVHRGAHDGLVEGLELGLAAEHRVGGVFHLHEAPVVAGAKVTEHRAEALCPAVQVLVDGMGVERTGNLLRLVRIVDVHEGVVGHLEGDAGLCQLTGQPGMAVEVDL